MSMNEYSVKTMEPVPSTGNLTNLVSDRARFEPTRTMLSRPLGEGWQKVSASEFDEEVRATAKGLIAAGIQIGDRVTLSYDWSKAPESVSFSLEEADLLTEMTGSYLISDNGDDTTDVIYELVVKVSMPVPEMMRKKTEQSTVDLALSQLKKRAEA